MDRTILHCDCNSFFASVETALDPSYKNVPMAVCGNQEDRHGIVLAKNDIAKSYGIQTAETVYSAKKKCPSLVIASPHYEKYDEYSKKVNQIYKNYTDLVEPFGIDESWLDVTASKRIFGNGIDIAEQIRNRVKKEIGITVSIGVSFNKVFAKLGSDYKKPDAITVISRENFKNIVYPLPASDLLFVGKKTYEQLSVMGIKTIGDLAEAPYELLKLKFGKMGDMMYRYSRGLDDSPVSPEVKEERKSISNGLTFKHDLVKADESRMAIDFLCDELGNKLKNKSLKCTVVALTIKDIYLHSIQRQRQLIKPTDIAREIADTAYKIWLDEWNDNKPVRMFTVSVSGLVDNRSSFVQLDLFNEDDEEKRQRERKREATVDIIRNKFGTDSISVAAVINNDIGISKSK